MATEFGFKIRASLSVWLTSHTWQTQGSPMDSASVIHSIQTTEHTANPERLSWVTTSPQFSNQLSAYTAQSQLDKLHIKKNESF